jgi:hypothetical protein
MKKKNLLSIALVLLVYAVTSFASFKVFSGVDVPGISTPIEAPKPGADGRLTFDPNLPRTQECPLNGAKYSKQQESWWKKHRPLGVMIENHEEARPQSGISFADVVYEAVAEGGITRFLAVYYCQDPGQLGPVRSARTYFIDFLSEYGDFPLYAHVGGANHPGPANAIGQLSDYEWRAHNDLDQFSIGFPVFWRDYERLGRTVATEHTMYSTAVKLWDYAVKNRKLTNKDDDGNSWDDEYTSYSFKDDEGSKGSQSMHIQFWDSMPNYFVDWKYDPASNNYKRNNGRNGGQPHLDKNTNKQLTSKNIVVLFMQERNANDGYPGNVHLLYKTTGTGKASIFLDGKEIKGTWRKKNRTSKIELLDSKGSEIELNKGNIWFEILPTDGVLTVK